MELKETKVYSINDFLDWYNRGELELAPKYQRKNVWNLNAESYLIDTILRGLPVPQIFMRQSIDVSLRKTYREIIDGQQRLRTIIKFYNNEIQIKKIHNKEFGGFSYNDLPDEIKEDFLNFQIPVELIKSNDDNIIFDLFMRVNTNSYTLNKQELRNAKYWGDFKVITYNYSRSFRKLFQDIGTFTINDFLRMSDADFISSLLILFLNGIQTDTPSLIDKAYEINEKISDDLLEQIENTFNLFYRFCEEIFSTDLYVFKYFNKKNYIYTLFAYYLIAKNNPLIKKHIKQDTVFIESTELRRMLSLIELEIEANISLDATESKYFEFSNLHSRRTTNSVERVRRVSIFIDLINNGV